MMINKKFIISLICLGIALAILVLLVDPVWQTVQDHRTTFKALQSRLTSLENLLSQTEALKKKEAKIREESEKILLALPEKKDIPALLVQFETLASAHNLILGSIDFQEISKRATQPTEQPQITSYLESLIVNLKLSGFYNDFKRYLNALENNIRAMDVQSINFNAGSSETDVLNFDFKIEVYYK